MPSKARLKVTNFTQAGYSVPIVCFQCPKPDCLDACPEDAIARNNLGSLYATRRRMDFAYEQFAAFQFARPEVRELEVRRMYHLLEGGE